MEDVHKVHKVLQGSPAVTDSEMEKAMHKPSRTRAHLLCRTGVLRKGPGHL